MNLRKGADRPSPFSPSEKGLNCEERLFKSARGDPQEDPMETTRTLSEYVLRTVITDLPDQVVEMSKKALLDWIGCCLGAFKEPIAGSVLAFLLDLGGNPQASVLGFGKKTNILQAAFLNGWMSHVLDYDDANSLVRTHPSAAVVPALLALAERDHRHGVDLIVSLVVGHEVSLRLGAALGRKYYDAGWHATPILGRFGGASAAGRLLGLETDQLCQAFGLCATQAAGLRATFGTMAKPFHAGKAAMDGLLAAMLAQRGMNAPKEILSDPSSFGSLFSTEYDPEKMTEGLGEHFLILSNSFKPYAACLLAHPAIDALIALKQEHAIDPERVEEIHVRMASLNLRVAANPNPQNSTEAKFSIPFGAALALIRGSAVESDFREEVLEEPLLKEVMRRVCLSASDALAEGEAQVKVILQDGRTFDKCLQAPRGSPTHPLSFGELEEKFRDLAIPVIGRLKARGVIEIVRGLEDLDDAARLVNLCCV